MLKVKDLLNVLSEETNVYIWQDDSIIAMYDGKNSIDKELNDSVVYRVSAGYYKIDVEIC